MKWLLVETVVDGMGSHDFHAGLTDWWIKAWLIGAVDVVLDHIIVIEGRVVSWRVVRFNVEKP